MNAVAPIDVVSDSCTDAAFKLGVTMGQLFLKAAANCRNGAGFSNNGEVGERWYTMWKQSGYNCLPPAVKDFVLAVNNGEYGIPFKYGCPECGQQHCHHSH